jgi:mandelate racemase
MFPDLTFKSLRVTPVSVPLSNPVRTASGTMTEAPLALIDILSEEGVEGRTYLFTYTPLVLKPICQLLENLAPLLQGTSLSPLNVERTLGARFRLLGSTGLVGMALAGIDMAVWDALARAADLPLVRLLGGTTKPVRAYFSQGMDGKEQGMKLAEEALARGFSAMKIKIGSSTVEEDVDVVTGVQSVLGKAAKLMVDYNQSLSVPEAVRRCRVLDQLGLHWVEEPVSQDDYLGHARVASLVNTPIQRGENWFSLAEMATSIAAGRTDLAMVDIMKIGGVSGWLRAASVAHEHRLPLSSHIFHEVTAHVMAVSTTADWLEYLDLAGPVLQSPLRIEAGNAILNESAGTGIDWNAEMVKKFRVR